MLIVLCFQIMFVYIQGVDGLMNWSKIAQYYKEGLYCVNVIDNMVLEHTIKYNMHWYYLNETFDINSMLNCINNVDDLFYYLAK